MSQMDSDQIINTQDIKQIIINDAKEKYQKMLMGQTKKVMPSKNVINNYGSYKENISNYAERIQNENNKFNTLLLRAKGNHDTNEKVLCENAYKKHIFKKVNIIEILRYLCVMSFFIIAINLYEPRFGHASQSSNDDRPPALVIAYFFALVLSILMIIIFYKLNKKYDLETKGYIAFFILFFLFCFYAFLFFSSTPQITAFNNTNIWEKIPGYIRYAVSFIPWRIYMLVSNKKRYISKMQKTICNLTYIFIDITLVILLYFYEANIYYFINNIFGDEYFLHDIVLNVLCVILMFGLIGIIFHEITRIKNHIVFFGKNVYEINLDDCMAHRLDGKKNYEFIKINNREFKVK